jgi:hypothetical protein
MVYCLGVTSFTSRFFTLSNQRATPCSTYFSLDGVTSMQWEKDVVPSLNKHVLTPKMDIINGETFANLFIITNYLFIKTFFIQKASRTSFY